MAADGTKQWRITAAPPPRTLNIQKFASSRAAELESLHSIVSSRLNGDFRSQRNKRRRTTGFDNKAANSRRRKRRRFGELKKEKDGELGSDGEGKEKKLPRRIRRRVELKKNPEIGFVTSGDGTRRLRTHLWHAKRFSMTKLWGFHLPLGLQGKGKGSRALLKWYKQGAVVHDASYYSAVQLEGPEDMVLSVLRMVLDPSPLAHSADCSTGLQSGCALCGDVYGSSILHHAGLHPFEAICPVTYIWRPICPRGPSVDEEDCKACNTDGCSKTDSASFRQLWIWMHPSALSEGYNALRAACQMKMDDTGSLVNCINLEGQLARLDVMGLKAFPLLKKILHPVVGSSEHVWNSKKCSVTEASDGFAVKHPQILSEEQSYSSKAILSLVVSDPRCVSAKSGTSVSLPDSRNDQGMIDDCQTEEHLNLAGNNGKTEVLPTSPINFENDMAHSRCKGIWDAAGGGICPPMEENVLSTEKYHQRLSLFCLKDANSGMSNEVQGSRLCPVMLLRNTNNAGLLKGWSLILLLSWVKAFWMPLISNGAHAIGLREKRWIANDVGLPYFPSDFPDCNAYYSSKAIEASASDQKMELRPPAKRPFKVAVTPPWNSICSSVDAWESQLNENPSLASSMNSSKEVAVARTSQMLKRFSNRDCANHLLLSPDDPVTDEVHISEHKKLCFVTLLLHAYKEGSFEEGAVICAPKISDIALWRSRSDDEESKLQLPQSSLASGKWEFQLPDDPIDRESYRQPIGFVTSGFVRGSKKLTAVGMAEATKLASLGQEQRIQMATKRPRKEIFVLVRNLRSPSYRLALATLVLARQEDDLDFL